MVELVLVIMLLGILSAVAIPKLMGQNFTAALTLRDQILSAMRSAQKTAVARRRLVCANQANAYSAPTFTIASNAGATSCNTALANTIDISALTSTPLATFYENLPNPMFFQPDGVISSDAAGALPAQGNVTFSFEGVNYNIRIDGATGYIQ
jgi:MSHA pilin protein MshC